MLVPEKTTERRSVSGASTGSAMTTAGSGSDSPVRMARSTSALWLLITLASAATTSPLLSSRMSPITTSRAGHSSGTPSRRTRAIGADAARSASRARSARYPVTTSAATMGTTPARMSRPSRVSPRITASTPAPARTRMKGSVTVCHSMPRIDGRRGGASSLGPLSTRRRAASACESPRSGTTCSRAVTASGGVACAGSLVSVVCPSSWPCQARMPPAEAWAAVQSPSVIAVLASGRVPAD